LGLVSVVAAKLGGAVTASDGHPDMSEALAHNAALNEVAIDYVAFDWARGEAPPPFPIVLASDVLYEPQACTLLADTLVRVLAPGGVALIADPGRPHWPRFLRKLEARDFTFRDARVKIAAEVPLLAWHPTAGRAHHLLRVTKSAFGACETSNSV
jgi:predicted nicotinamide N-methyase